MLSVNVKIITGLKNFITTIMSDRTKLEQYCTSDKAFTRTRKLPFDKLALLLLRLCKKTLSVELEDFFTQAGNADSSYSVAAFVKQRLKLKADFFHCWNQELCRLFYLHYGKSVLRWKGFLLIAADGSNISLINNVSLRDYFGGQANQHTNYVQAKTLYYYDILNELIVLPLIKPYRYGELQMAYDIIDQLPPDTVTIYDRNFSNYKMIALHLLPGKERKFIIRAKETMRIIRDFIASGKASAIVTIPPTPEAIAGMKKSGYTITKEDVLTVRLVRVELSSGIEVLITNLWEEEGHATTEFKELYAFRWSVETNISLQKNIFQLESFSGLSAQTVLQDFFATVMMTNLHNIIIKDAQLTLEKDNHLRTYPVKVNKNKSVGRLKHKLVSIFLQCDVQSILTLLHNHFVREVVPIRKGRSFPRVRKNRQSKSKWRTFTNFKPSY